MIWYGNITNELRFEKIFSMSDALILNYTFLFDFLFKDK